MGLLEKLLGKFGNQAHYVLKCRRCEFVHHVPNGFKDEDIAFSVQHGHAKLTCVFGGKFTYTLDVGEFFHSYLEASSGLRVSTGIAANMKVLHPHMLEHSDPLFLWIKQTPTSTAHEYRTIEPDLAGVPYVRYRLEQGTDIVGSEQINTGKAEIPGVSWKVDAKGKHTGT